MKTLSFLKVIFITASLFITEHSYREYANQVMNPQQEILGIWYLEGSPSDKIEFLSNGILKRYIDNQLESTSSYSVGSSCDGESSPNELYLTEVDSDGDIYCTYINGINIDNSNELSLTPAGTMKVLIYVRQ